MSARRFVRLCLANLVLLAMVSPVIAGMFGVVYLLDAAAVPRWIKVAIIVAMAAAGPAALMMLITSTWWGDRALRVLNWTEEKRRPS